MTKTITWRKLLNENIDHTIAIGLHVLALISFVVFTMFAVNTVQSEEIDKSCIGNNLINELPNQVLEDARSEAATTPNGQGLFWKVSKEGQQPS